MRTCVEHAAIEIGQVPTGAMQREVLTSNCPVLG